MQRQNPMHIKLLKKLRTTPVLAVLSFAVTFCALFVLAALLQFAPFGNNSFACMDAEIQYLDFFAYLKRFLMGETSLLYTFEKTLGGNNIAVFAYYLSSPFNLIVLFFRQENFHTMFTVLVALKLAAAAAFFSLFLKIRFPQMKPPFVVALSVGYAFGQYSFAQASNIMWLDGVYMLPLLMLGIYRMAVRKNKKLLLILSAGLGIIFNWYSGLINCIFGSIYYLYEDSLANGFAGAKSYIRRLLRFAACMALGLGLSLFLFLPAMLALRGGRAGMDFSVFGQYFISSFATAFTNFSIGSTSAEGSVSLYCSFACPAGIAAWFATSCDRGRKRQTTAIFLLVILLLFYLSPFIFLFSLAQKVESYWYRYSYVGIAALLCISARFYAKIGNERVAVERKFLPAAAAAALLTVFVFFNDVRSLLWLALCFAFLAACCFLANNAAADPHRAPSYAVKTDIRVGRLQIIAVVVAAVFAATTVLELCLNGSLLMEIYKTSTVNSYTEYSLQESAQIRALTEYDDGFYRVNQTDTRNKSANGLTANYNESIAFGYRSINGYTSDPDENSRNFLTSLGYNLMGNMNIVNTSILAADSLLGVKYVLSSYDIDGLQKLENLGTYNGKSVYLNPYALPMVFTYTPLPQGQPSYTGNPFEYQNELFSYLTGTESAIWEKAETQQTSSGGNIVITVATDASAAEYLYVKFSEWAYFDVTVDGNTYSMGEWLSPDILYFPNGENGTAEAVIATDKINEVSVYRLNTDALAQACSLLQTHAALNTVIRDGYVRSELTADSGEMLFLSVPYEDGWEITVNGKDAEYFLLGGCMICVPLEEGANTVELKFSVPGLGAGIAATAVCAGITVWLAVCDAKNIRLRDSAPVAAVRRLLFKKKLKSSAKENPDERD